MSFDPTIEPTVKYCIEEIIIDDIFNTIGAVIPEGLIEELVDYIDMVTSSGDRPEYVPSKEAVKHLIIERLLQIGTFMTDDGLNKMAEYYKNEWRV